MRITFMPIKNRAVPIRRRGATRNKMRGGSISHIQIGSSDIPLDSNNTNLKNLKQALRAIDIGSRKSAPKRYIKF